MWKKLAFTSITFVIFVIAVELLLGALGISPAFQNRFFIVNRNYDYPEVFRRDSELFWTLRGPQTISSLFFESGTYRINSLGMRGEEPGAGNGVTRIAVLGNSCSFGWQVTEEETYLFRLIKLLETKSSESDTRTFEGINGAVPGYSSFQGKLFFEREIAPLRPSFTLIMFGWNDQWAAAGNISDLDQEPPSQWITSVHNGLNRLRLYRGLRSLILSASEPDISDMIVKEGLRPRVSLTEFRENLLEICNSSKKTGSAPILLTSPIPALEAYYPPHRYSPMHRAHEKYNLVTRQLAFDEGIDIIDLAAEFDGRTDLFEDAEQDPIHFNAQGHQLAAELIAERISALLSAHMEK